MDIHRNNPPERIKMGSHQQAPSDQITVQSQAANSHAVAPRADHSQNLYAYTLPTSVVTVRTFLHKCI